MSLVNQMLQDLEQRRTAEASVSPLGGLSASGAAVATTQSINYLLLGTTLILLVTVVLALIYLFGGRQAVVAEPVAEMMVSSVEVKAEPEIQQSIVEMDPVWVEKESVINKIQSTEQSSHVPVKVEKTELIKKPVIKGEIESAGSISIREPVSNSVGGAPTVIPMNEETQSDRSSVNKIIRPLTSEQQAQIAFQDAVKLLGRGDEPAAQHELEKALSIEPVHMRARETLSALLLNTGRVSEAAQTLSEGLRLRPTSTPLAKLYARVLVDQGDNDAAVAVLERARPLVATDPDYYALMGVLYRGVGKHAQASQVYQQILQARPGVAVWWMGLALSEDAMGSSAKALEAYQRAHRAGGLKAEVLQYVQSRITALTPSVADKSLQVVAVDDSDGFED